MGDLLEIPLDDSVDNAEAKFITDPLADQDPDLFPSTNERLLERQNEIKQQSNTNYVFSVMIYVFLLISSAIDGVSSKN